MSKLCGHDWNQSLDYPTTEEGHICKNWLVIIVRICDNTKQPKLDTVYFFSLMLSANRNYASHSIIH